LGADGNEEFVYRGDVVNRALQMLGAELQMFIPKSEVTHKKHDDLDHLSDLELVEVLANEAQQLLLYHQSRARDWDAKQTYLEIARQRRAMAEQAERLKL
jgi:hypothetical protein